MISLNILSQVNNIVCLIACFSCFLHALHSGIHTNLAAKIILFVAGIGLYSSIVDSNVLLIPGHKYVMFANILFGLSMIVVFVVEAHRSNYLKRWYSSIQGVGNLLLKRGNGNVGRKN